MRTSVIKGVKGMMPLVVSQWFAIVKNGQKITSVSFNVSNSSRFKTKLLYE